MSMREIKFRAWDKKSTKVQKEHPRTRWVYFTLEELAIGNINISDFENWEIMQYTGLKSKSGVEIWEGDILQWYVTPFTYESEDSLPVAGAKNLVKGVVRYCGGGFDLLTEWKNKGVQLDGSKTRNGIPLMSFTTDSFEFSDSWLAKHEFLDTSEDKIKAQEVIGNIYENPELLK